VPEEERRALALVLIHAASALQLADGRLASASRRWRGLAVAATLGFALLLPLQGFATWRGLSQGLQQDAARRACEVPRSPPPIAPCWIAFPAHRPTRCGRS